MLFLCYSLLNSQNILTNDHVNNWRKVGYLDNSDVAKQAAEVAQQY